MSAVELPSLGYFENGNGWLGSVGTLRYQIMPPEEGQLRVALWQGPFSRPYAPEVGEQQSFPLTQDGLDALAAFLAQTGADLTAAPPFSPADIEAFYQQKKREEAEGTTQGEG